MEVVSGNVIDAQMDLETLNDSFLIIRMDKTDAPAPTMTTPTKTTPTTTTPTATTPTTTTPTTTTTTTTTSTSTTASMCPRNDGKIKLNPSDASMSSSVAAHDTSKKADTSDRCIDGKTKKSHGSKSWICITDKENAPWFAIDYGQKVSVGKVILNNRGDNNHVCEGKKNECYERTADVVVRLSDELPADGNEMFEGGELIATWAGPGRESEEIVIKSDDGWEKILGRYLIIQMDKTGSPDHLNLQEVTGYGKKCD